MMEAANKYIDLIWQLVLPLFNFDLLMEVTWLLAASGFSWLLARRVERWVGHENSKHGSGRPFLSGSLAMLVRLIFPAALLLLLVMYGAIADFSGMSAGLLDSIISLLIAWILLRFVTSFIGSENVSRAVSLTIWIIAALKIVGVLDQTTKAMDKIAFTIGGSRISMLIVVKAVIILAATIWLASVIVRFLDRVIKKPGNGFASNTQELLSKISRIILFTIAGFIGLKTAGVDLTSLAVAMGAIGVGVGLGLQKITSNFISGLILLFERTITTGDLVQVGSVHGWVRHMGIRHAVIESFNGNEILVPNEDFITQQVTNWTYTNPRTRADFKIGVAYGSDPEKICKIVIEEMSNHPRCMSDPAPTCYLREFGDSSLNFMAMFWVADVRDGVYGAQSEIMASIYNRFNKEGIEIPFPITKVILEK